MEQQHQSREEPRVELYKVNTPDQNNIADEQARSRSATPITSEAVETLLAQLDRDQKEQAQRNDRRLLWLVPVAGLYTLLAPKFPPPWLLPQVLLIAALLLMLPQRSRAQRIQRTRRSLAQSEDVRAIPPLLSISPFLNTNLGIKSEDRRLFLQALTRLLPRLQASDTSLLDATQLGILHKGILRWDSKGDIAALQVAALKALAQLGDSKAIPDVERLSERLPQTPEEAQVHEAAQECLPVLKARAAQERVGQTLLRAASSTDTPADSLLRPASSTTETEPQQQLLRASTAEESNEP